MLKAGLAHPGQPVNTTSLENFFPGYFALIMATGIVSIGMFLWSYTRMAGIFLGLNVFFYLLLWIILILRIIKFPVVV